jgi:hypothetical protein
MTIWYRSATIVPVNALNTSSNGGVVEMNVHAPTATSPHLVKDHDPAERYRARRIIEAQRLGITPDEDVREFTLGRDREMDTLSNWLESDSMNSGAFLIEGAYGVGKTHLLDFIAIKAQENGYASARVQMDPNETPFNEPRRVYAEVVQKLTYTYQGETRHLLRNFLTDAFSAGYDAEDHQYFRMVRRDRYRIPDIVWEWIEAQGQATKPQVEAKDKKHYRTLYKPSCAYNVYTYLLSSLSWIAYNWLGLKGLLVLFDESESFSLASTQTRALRAGQFVEALMRTAQDDPMMMKTGSRIGLSQSHRDTCEYTRDIPFSYARPARLKLAFAFTDLSDLRDRVRGTREVQSLSLQPIASNTHLREAYDKIRHLYCLAYDLNIKKTPDDFDRVLRRSTLTRTFIKGCVESLDEWSAYP